MDVKDTVLGRKLAGLVAGTVLAEVYRDKLADEPLVGFVTHYSSHVLVLRKLDEHYRYDGVAAVRPSDITRVKTGGRELGAGAFLVEQEELPALPTIPDVALLEISAATTIFQKLFGHVCLHVERVSRSVCYIGEAGDLDDDFVELKQFGTLKGLDRSEALVRVDELTRVEADGKYPRQLLAAHRRFSFPRAV
ncbi:MAG: hypothetical protein JNK04_22285 [Myxococcales bacterium]|nr:hypothetical protein [Myxococcales bacterium]